MRNPSSPLPASLQLHPAQVELQQYRLPVGQDQSVGGHMILTGTLNLDALRRAIAHLPLLFDVFRWQFDPARTEAAVSIADHYQPLELLRSDVSQAVSPRCEADAWLHRQFATPLATAQHKFFDIQLLRLSDIEHWLLVRGHRLLLDDTGFDGLMAGIANSYARAVTGEKQPESVTPYASEVNVARLYVNSMAYGEDRAHWTKQLPELPEPLLGVGQQAVSGPKRYSFSGNESFGRALQQASDRLDEPPTHLLLAALTAYFARINQRDRCIFGRVVAGRQTKGQLSVVGRFDRLLPIRLRYQPGQSLRLLAQAIRRQHRSDNSRRQYPMSHVAAALNTTSPRLFDVLVQHQPIPPALNLPGLACRVHRFASAGADVPLHLCWQEGNAHQPGTLRVNGQPAFISEGDVKSLLVQLEHLLLAFARSPDAPLASFEVLPHFISEYLSSGRPASRSMVPLMTY